MPPTPAAEIDGEAGAGGGFATRPAFALAPVLVLVAIKIAVNMAVASRYGWHRDELYYADAGRHLSFGYVDFPPITAWIRSSAAQSCSASHSPDFVCLPCSQDRE